MVVERVVDGVDPAHLLPRQLFRRRQKASWSMSGPSSKAAAEGNGPWQTWSGDNM